MWKYSKLISTKLISIQNQYYFKILYAEINFSETEYKKELLKIVTELYNKKNTQKMLTNLFPQNLQSQRNVIRKI